MFLNKDNSIKWKFLIAASVVTIVLCVLGILWLDKPLFLLLRDLNNPIFSFCDVVFDSKVWLVTFFTLVCIIFIKKSLNSKDKKNKKIIKFNLKEKINNFIVKSKDNYVFLIFCSVFFANVIASILKFTLGRERPIFFEALGQSGFFPFTHEWAFNSMPSGHSTASFAGLVMIGLLFPKYKWATWTLAIIIGISRISFGAHFPSDVLLGAFIGMVSADIVKYFFYKKLK